MPPSIYFKDRQYFKKVSITLRKLICAHIFSDVNSLPNDYTLSVIENFKTEIETLKAGWFRTLQFDILNIIIASISCNYTKIQLIIEKTDDNNVIELLDLILASKFMYKFNDVTQKNNYVSFLIKHRLFNTVASIEGNQKPSNGNFVGTLKSSHQDLVFSINRADFDFELLDLLAEIMPPGVQNYLNLPVLLIQQWITQDMKGLHETFTWINNHTNDELQYTYLKEYFSNNLTYRAYVLFLARNWQHNQKLYTSCEKASTIDVIGESHSLTFCGVNLDIGSLHVNFDVNWIMGLKMHHHSLAKSVQMQNLKLALSRLSVDRDCIFVCGEIDLRIDEGILQYSEKNGIAPIIVAKRTIDKYVGYLKNNVQYKVRKLLVMGTPAPHEKTKKFADYERAKVDLLRNLIRDFNKYLGDRLKQENIGFLDVYSTTVDAHGWNNGKYAIDFHHQHPALIRDLLRGLEHE